MTLERKLLTVFAIVFMAFAAAAAMTVWSGNELAKIERERSQHYSRLEILDMVLLGFDDAETGQRGFLLTGDTDYLSPYYSATNATETALLRLHEAFASNPAVHQRLAELKAKKFSELERTIRLRQDEGLSKALEIVRSNEGRVYMEEVRNLVEDLKGAEKNALSVLATNTTGNVTIYQYSVGLFIIFLMLAVISLYSFMQIDATQKRKALERLTHEATHDGMTDLANRNLFTSILSYSIPTAQRYGRLLGILFIDLDGFKAVNDTHGHDIGDEVLKAVALRLKRVCRESDVVARIGGDEFLILLPNTTKQGELATVATHLIEALCEPIFVDHLELHIGASIGVAIYPKHGQSAASLIKAADAAMYRAKQAGRGQYRFFSDDKHSPTSHQKG